MLHSFFSIELCFRLDLCPNLLAILSEKVNAQSIAATVSTPQRHWAFYRGCAEACYANLNYAELGCWEFYDDDARAKRDYDEWCSAMVTAKTARTSPSAPSDIYRNEPRYMTFTMAFLLPQRTPCERQLARVCDIPESELWLRQTFGRILQGMRGINFASVKSDIAYLIPRDNDWGLTRADLSDSKFGYLRALL